LDTPELVPFRMTPNIFHALGIFKGKDTFQSACETTLEVLRSNQILLKPAMVLLA
jgi:phosphatidylinositol kinase/protein kinase (PI-3  family)